MAGGQHNGNLFQSSETKGRLHVSCPVQSLPLPFWGGMEYVPWKAPPSALRGVCAIAQAAKPGSSWPLTSEAGFSEWKLWEPLAGFLGGNCMQKERRGRKRWPHCPTQAWGVATKHFPDLSSFCSVSLFPSGMGGRYPRVVGVRKDPILGSCGQGTATYGGTWWNLDEFPMSGTWLRSAGTSASELLLGLLAVTCVRGVFGACPSRLRYICFGAVQRPFRDCKSFMECFVLLSAFFLKWTVLSLFCPLIVTRIQICFVFFF